MDSAPVPGSAYRPPDTPLDVLHDDHAILVVNKPAGLLSVPGRGADLADCLLARLRAVFPMALLVHRLDRDTSGVMVFAQSPAAQRHLPHGTAIPQLYIISTAFGFGVNFVGHRSPTRLLVRSHEYFFG